MSCLFDSLSTYVDINSHELRQSICYYLDTNPIFMDDLNAETIIEYETNTPLKNYVANMRQDHTLGGAIEIRAFINIFKINILVKSIPNNREIEFLIDPNAQWKCILWTGNHFDPTLL